MILSYLFFSGCGINHYQRYQEVTRVNTIAAYEEYLRENPDSPFTNEVHNKIVNIKFGEEFRRAMNTETPDAMVALLQKNPDNAKAKEGLKYKIAQQAQTRQAFEQYLHAYPLGTWVGEAKENIVAIMGPKMKTSYEQEGRELASKWLTLLDQGRWGEASALSVYGPGKQFSNQEEFETFLISMRQTGGGIWTRDSQGIFQETGAPVRLGVIERKVMTVQFMVQNERRPIGDYVVVVCETSFDRAGANETVVAVRTSSGGWFIDGYIIQLQR